MVVLTWPDDVARMPDAWGHPAYIPWPGPGEMEGHSRPIVREPSPVTARRSGVSHGVLAHREYALLQGLADVASWTADAAVNA